MGLALGSWLLALGYWLLAMGHRLPPPPMIYSHMQAIWIGTSGWIYKHWAESFYPATWPKGEHLEFYAQHFPTVEINATFYRLPPETMVQGWCRKAPAGFLYAAKGSRYITHMKKLMNVDQGLTKYFDRIKHLKEYIGPILWQLPPNLHNDPARLDDFLARLPHDYYQHAVEFRHPSWNNDQVYEVLRNHKAACVWISSQRMPVDFTTTANFVYLRFHGLEHGAAHDYTQKELEPWAEQLCNFASKRKPAFVYFNNDWNTRAPQNAKLLMEMVGPYAVQPFEFTEPQQQRTKSRGVAQKTTEPRSKRLQKESRSRTTRTSRVKKLQPA
jgi:uncharacterized protein YecE (DUF72 family)